MGERGAGTVHEPEAAGDFQFSHCDLHQFATGELRLNGEAWDEGDAVAARHEALDGLETGQLDSHVEGCLVARECLNDTLAQGRGHGVCDEILRAEVADGDLFLFREGMFWVDDESDRVGVDGDGVEAAVVGAEGEDAEFGGSLEELVGDLAGKGALYGDADVREVAAKFVEHRKQPEAGVFVSGEGKAAAFEGAQFFEGGGGFAAQAQETFGVAAEQRAGCGERSVARSALEEGFANFLFQLADSVADGRLGAAHAGGGAGEAFFFSDGEKGFELVEIHREAMERGSWGQKCCMNSIYTNAKNYKFALWLALCETY
jgi:hypothetical protein